MFSRVICTFPRKLISRKFSTQSGQKKTSFLRNHYGKIIALTAVTVSTYVGLEIYNNRNPSAQLPMDYSKKTICVLGSGWASTSFLKDLDTINYNVIVVSPRNYFLFTPLLPSCTVGTVELRSIMQPIRYITRKKTRECMFVEGDCIDIDPVGKTVVVEDNSELKGDVSKQTLKYDYLIVACGAENATFGIPGVREHSCFLKEIWDARKIRTKLMDCLETAAFPGQTESEVDRLLNMVVVGGGPTVSIEITEFVTNLPIFLNAQGVEYAAELHDFLVEDLTRWYPDMAGKIKITLIEATNNVLPMFSKQLIEYTEKTFAENKVTILNNTMVKEVKDKEITVLNKDKKLETIPYGLLVWATGNTARPVVSNLIKKLNPALQTQRRGLVVDEYLKVKGADDIYCLGDASATKFAPTAQVAAKQGKYLSDRFNRIGYLEADKDNMERSGVKFSDAVSLLPPFSFDNMGMLAYIGSDKAIADFPGGIQFGGMMTYYFWRSAYLSNLFSMRNRFLVAGDWCKKAIFGRDFSRE